MDDDAIRRAERHQIDQILQLEYEELQVEEVDDDDDDDDDSDDLRAATDGLSSGEFSFDTGLAPLHTYLGEVEDTHRRFDFLDEGSIVNLPLFYLEGVVLFPEAILPLRVILPHYVSAIERAMRQVDSPCTIGVVRAYWVHDSRRYATIGTTAEIRQYRRLDDGSLNVLTRGQQRFLLKRRWMDSGGAPCGEVQIIQEDLPLRMPRDAIGRLEPLSNWHSHSLSDMHPSNSPSYQYGDDGLESNSEESFESELSPAEKRIHQSAIDSYGYDMIDESTSSDDDKFVCKSEMKYERSYRNDPGSTSSFHFGGKGPKRCWKNTGLNQFRKAPRAFWPYWVYHMYDSYVLAKRTAEMWKQIVGAPSMDGLVKKPDLLSFHIASKIPVSESTRQELLEINGVSYRLQREIELLLSFDLVQCKNCQTVIARRSDMLVMSSEGPLGSYVNPNGFVHEVMTFYKASGLALSGRPAKEYSWFPGYAWTIANCANCESSMGWLFTATMKKLKPQSFWGLRSCQIAENVR